MSTSEGKYDFIIDIDELENVLETLNENCTKIEKIIDEIYTIIKDELSDAWSGESYNTFKERCMQYKPALEGLVSVMKAYAKLIDPTENNDILPICQYYTNITNVINGGEKIK